MENEKELILKELTSKIKEVTENTNVERKTKMKAKVVYLVDCDYPEDYENYHFNIGIFTSFTNAKSAIIEELTDADDVIIDTCEKVTKNNRHYWTFITNKGKYNIMECALNTKWLCPIEKEYIKED